MFDRVKRFRVNAGFDSKSKLRKASFFAKLQDVLSHSLWVKVFRNFLLKNVLLENYGILGFAGAME